jgi:osmoprotectant transport system substrate-binding protein
MHREGRGASSGPRALLLLLVLALGAGGCGNEDDDEASGGRIKSKPDNRAVELTIGSKSSTEERILGEIYSQGLEAAGYTVETSDFASGDEARQAVEAGEISGYPEYSTVLLAAAGVSPQDLPTDPVDAATRASDAVRQAGLRPFAAAPFSRSSVITVPGRLAERFQLEKISDLEGVSQRLRIAASPECSQSPACLPRVEDVYGLRFAEVVTTPAADRFGVLGGDRAELSVVLATDPTLFVSPLNYPTLIDDEQVFPPSIPIFVASREAVREAGPDFQRTVERVQVHLDREQMQELSSLVLFYGEPVAAVARDYLAEFGFIPE